MNLGDRIENSVNEFLDWQTLTAESDKYVLETPPHRQFIFEHTLPRGIVGMLNASGGTGKTFLALQMAIAMAAGIEFGPFKSTKDFNVLYIGGEDSTDELWRRLYYCMADMGVTKKAISGKLATVSMMGKSKPFIEINKQNNPVLTAQYHWLYESISKFPNKLDALIIDPLSRFYGMDENNNVHGTAWIVAMEKIAYELGTAVLFTHHTGKAKTSLHDTAGRGASAFYDGCRWVAAARRMEQKTASKYQVSARDYIEFDVIKNSYAKHLPASQYFRRSDNGVLINENLWKDRMNELADMIESLQKEDTPFSEIPGKLKQHNSTFEKAEMRYVIRTLENRKRTVNYS